VRSPKTEVFGVETEAARDTWLSLHEGRIVRIDLPDTIADGMRTLSPGELTFPIIQRHAKGVVLVSERDVREAMIFLMTRLKLVVEPTGAVGVAAVLKRRIPLNGRTAVVVLSGGNVDPTAYARILAE
jgi:threonine dehydratase